MYTRKANKVANPDRRGAERGFECRGGQKRAYGDDRADNLVVGEYLREGAEARGHVRLTVHHEVPAREPHAQFVVHLGWYIHQGKYPVLGLLSQSTNNTCIILPNPNNTVYSQSPNNTVYFSLTTCIVGIVWKNPVFCMIEVSPPVFHTTRLVVHVALAERA